jgi:hypothetical protein
MTYEKKLCQDTSDTVAGIPPPAAPQPERYISTLNMSQNKQRSGSNTYHICCPHRTVNLCSDESHQKEKEKILQ